MKGWSRRHEIRGRALEVCPALGLRDRLFDIHPGETKELTLASPSSEEGGCPWTASEGQSVESCR